ncbi:MAG TPA: hypothetical protein VKU00_29235, partial [Chthonomonadaceae bacterium]|nr:hypothetical protein [Chthonomonadaceae bacterium]
MATTTYTVFEGEIVEENRAGVLRDYVPDPLGSTVALLDNTQTQTDTFTYWPYGEVRTQTGGTPTPFQFLGTLGLYKDSSTLTYSKHRYIATLIGRWLTATERGRELEHNPYIIRALNLTQSPYSVYLGSTMPFDIPDPWYRRGRYCGSNAGRTYDPCLDPGKTDPNNPGSTPTPAPRNPVDSCCKDHDCCWA